MAPWAGSVRDDDYRAACARCDAAITCRLQFKRPCGRAYQQAELLRRRFHPPAAARSRPISRSIGWLRACDRGIAPRYNNASTARCNRARKNVRTDVRQGCAIFGRPRRVHARVAVPTWMSQRSLQRVIVSSGARISNDRLLTGIGCARMIRTPRIARHHNPSANRTRGAARPRGGLAWRGHRGNRRMGAKN
jgi:hypothetical protein